MHHNRRMIRGIPRGRRIATAAAFQLAFQQLTSVCACVRGICPDWAGSNPHYLGDGSDILKHCEDLVITTQSGNPVNCAPPWSASRRKSIHMRGC